MIRRRLGPAGAAILAAILTAILAAILAGLTPGHAAAQQPEAAQEAPPNRLEGAALLDGRAPAFAAIKPTDLADGFALMDLLGGIFPDALRAFASVRDGLGLYAFSASELADAGLSPDALVLASLGVADADRGDAKGKAARPLFVRHRFVMRVTDGDKFLRSATALLASSSAGPLKALAKKHRARLVARLGDGAVVVVRVLGAFAVVDYADPWGGRPPNASADVARLLPQMTAPPRHRLSDALEQGARALLAETETSIALVVEPAALGPLFVRAPCRKDWAGGEGAGLIDNAAVLLRLHPFQWRLELAWSPGPAARARWAAAADDDGLLDARAAAADGIAAAVLSTGSLDVIRGAPRPPLFGGGPARVYDSVEACGPVAAVALGARLWPQLLALELETTAGRLGLAPLLANLRNVAAVVRRVPAAPQTWRELVVWLASVPAAAGETLSRLLAQQGGGRPEQQRFGERTPTFFDLPPSTGFVEAAVERIAGHHDALAVTPESSGLGWYYRMARRPARFGAQTRLGALYVNLATLLELRAEAADAGTRAAVRLAAGQLGQLGGNLTFDGARNLLRLELNLSATP